ncbi:MAG: response regulator [Cyanobacteriota bacterium]|nr:response regulator [Cyanobacteriota bacterium]
MNCQTEQNQPLILITDDNPNNIKVIADFLKKSGFETLVATSGEFALKILERTQPDLILLDVVMPGMDGFETCRQIKADRRTRDIPIIFISAIADNTKEKIEGLRMGGVDYISKPIITEEVLARIEVHLTLRKLTKELTVAKEKAEAANRSKSLFLAQMNHELRSPMSAIVGFADLIKRSKKIGSKEKDFAKNIHDAGSHLLNLIEDILDVSKIEAGKMELSPRHFNFPSFLRNIVQMLQLRAKEKQIYLNCELDPNLPQVVEADEQRLRQVLINLLGNAIKFTEKGGVTLKVSIPEDSSCLISANSGEVCPAIFEIQDTGIGIAPEELDKIFVPFEQVGDRRNKAQGTGLGLAISQQIIALMGSHIEVSSALGEGSTFSFKIYLKEEKTNPTKNKDIIVEKVKEDSPEKPLLRILIAEDYRVSQTIAKHLFKRLGYDADAVASGEEVLEALRRQPYDLILMDTHMKGMDGIETTRRIFQEGQNGSRPRIIATSANVMAEHQQECLAAGMDDFIGKPFELEEFARVVGSFHN